MKTSKKLCDRMMHGKAIWKPGITEIAKASKGFAPGAYKEDLQCPLQPKAARANVLTHVGLWSMAIKLNPSWKTVVSKSAWIKPWMVTIFYFQNFRSRFSRIKFDWRFTSINKYWRSNITKVLYLPLQKQLVLWNSKLFRLRIMMLM